MAWIYASQVSNEVMKPVIYQCNEKVYERKYVMKPVTYECNEKVYERNEVARMSVM